MTRSPLGWNDLFFCSPVCSCLIVMSSRHCFYSRPLVRDDLFVTTRFVIWIMSTFTKVLSGYDHQFDRLSSSPNVWIVATGCYVIHTHPCTHSHNTRTHARTHAHVRTHTHTHTRTHTSSLVVLGRLLPPAVASLFPALRNLPRRTG